MGSRVFHSLFNTNGIGEWDRFSWAMTTTMPKMGRSPPLSILANLESVRYDCEEGRRRTFLKTLFEVWLMQTSVQYRS